MTILVFIVERIWPALAASAALGFGIGLITNASRPIARSGGLATWLAGISILAAAGLAGAQVVPGRPGLVLEIGALVVLAYLPGCMLGCLARRIFRPAGGQAGEPGPDAAASPEGVARG
jgi:hypothetical protein